MLQRIQTKKANIDKVVAGTKGSKSILSPTVCEMIKLRWKGSYTYTQIHNNDSPFVLTVLLKARTCKQCKNDICRWLRVVPRDLVFEHKERFYFPVNGDWKNKHVL